MTQVKLKCTQCNATCWVRAQSDYMGYSMHEDVDLDEAEWTRGDWPECEHDSDPTPIDVSEDDYYDPP